MDSVINDILYCLILKERYYENNISLGEYICYLATIYPLDKVCLTMFEKYQTQGINYGWELLAYIQLYYTLNPNLPIGSVFHGILTDLFLRSLLPEHRLYNHYYDMNVVYHWVLKYGLTLSNEQLIWVLNHGNVPNNFLEKLTLTSTNKTYLVDNFHLLSASAGSMVIRSGLFMKNMDDNPPAFE